MPYCSLLLSTEYFPMVVFWLLTNLKNKLFPQLIRSASHTVLHISISIFPGNPPFNDLFNLSTIICKVIDKQASGEPTLIKRKNQILP